MAAFFLPIVVITYALRSTHYFHFHHYTGSLLALPLLWYPHPNVVYHCGFANGVLVEGAARWGYDPWWIPRKATIATQEKLSLTKNEKQKSGTNHV